MRRQRPWRLRTCPHATDRRAKRAARAGAAARAGCDPALGAHACGACSRVIARRRPAPSSPASGRWPARSTSGRCCWRCTGAAIVIALPETPPRGKPLIFRRWQPGDADAPERFGTLPPGRAGGARRICCWCRCWRSTGAGRRLGYGGGYYDRTLPLLPGAARIGCAFAARKSTRCRPGRPTQRLDAVATERGVIGVGSGRA